MDETHIRVKGEWMYLDRAAGTAGKTAGFHLSRKRGVNAAKAFPRKVMKSNRVPAKITLDACQASHWADAASQTIRQRGRDHRWDRVG